MTTAHIAAFVLMIVGAVLGLFGWVAVAPVQRRVAIGMGVLLVLVGGIIWWATP